MMKIKVKTMYGLCLGALAVVSLWIIWFNLTMDRLPRRKPAAATSVLYGAMLNPQAKSIKKDLQKAPSAAANYFEAKADSKPSPPQLVTLPGDFHNIDLSGWEIFNGLTSSDETVEMHSDDDIQGKPYRPRLTFKNKMFYLNGMPFRIFSGAIHYFRIVPEYWADRLKKMKACGLNTIETYVPWNLHEPSPGKFDFEGILNLRSFLILAAELGLYVILRPGPYICSEFEYGGLPGWLMADPSIQVRVNNKAYLQRVNMYLSVLLPSILDLQFSEGGPIIMFQVENEYTSFAADGNHVRLLYYMFREYGLKEMIATSDNGHSFYLLRDSPEYDITKYALNTINGDNVRKDHTDFIHKSNRHMPIMVMELWCGWFDLWGVLPHQTKASADLNETMQYLLSVGASFNLYMFIGGTNFGFTNGAVNVSGYSLVTTSYDYDAPLTESGDTTPKYFFIRDMLLKFYKSIGIPYLPEVPLNTPKASYGELKMVEIMEWKNLLAVLPMIHQGRELDYMETYKDERGEHRNLGYIIYSHMLRPGVKWDRKYGQHLTGYVLGRLTAMINDEIFFIGTDHAPITEEDFLWDKSMKEDDLRGWHGYVMDCEQVMREPRWLFAFYQKIKEVAESQNSSSLLQLDLMVENQGRVNFAKVRSNTFDIQRRGLKGAILTKVFGISDEEWSVRRLHFDKQQCKEISESNQWMTLKAYRRMLEDQQVSQKQGPTLYRTYLNIQDVPRDTYVKLEHWTKGVVIVNQFNLGRYWKIGPQRALYLPGPLLRQGRNEIIIFEERFGGDSIKFQDTPDLG